MNCRARHTMQRCRQGATPGHNSRPLCHAVRHARRWPSLTCILAGVVAAAIGLPCTAHAEPRVTDIVLGAPAEERSIPASELPDITAAHALVMDKEGTVFFERDADAPIKIASTTKVMTALVALENAPLDMVITVDLEAATVGESCVGLQEGDTLTLEEALIGLMVMSGNDTATAIATAVGARIDPTSKNPYRTFIDAMNDKAAELGCKDTLFENAHGLDFGAWVGDLHSTTRDMGLIFSAAMQNEQFRALDNSDRTEMHVTSADGTPRSLPLKVRNKIHGQHGNIGGKTGSTYEARDCFVGAFSREPGGEIYVAVYGVEGDDQRFADTVALANWYYAHLASVPLANTPVTSNGDPILAQVSCEDWTDKTLGATLGKPEQTATVFSLAGGLEQQVDLDTLRGSIEQGQGIGTVSYTQDGKAVAEAELVASSSLAAPNPLDWVMVQFDRLVRFFQGKPSVAESIVLNKVPDPLAYDTWG